MLSLPKIALHLFSLDYGTLIINIYKNRLWKDEDLRGQKYLCPIGQQERTLGTQKENNLEKKDRMTIYN